MLGRYLELLTRSNQRHQNYHAYFDDNRAYFLRLHRGAILHWKRKIARVVRQRGRQTYHSLLIKH